MQSFAEHRQALTRFLTGRLGNPALAQDLAYETWMRAARALFDADKADAAIDTIAGTLPIRVRRLANLLVMLSPKD